MKNIYLLSVLIALLSGCASINSVNFYSMDEDITLGAQVKTETRQSMQQQGVPCNANPATVKKMNDMVKRIASVSDHPELPYEVDVYSTDVVNAMAAPGGKIIVFEGLWDKNQGLCKDDDETAAVLAHEIAHVNCRHSTKQMSRNTLYGGALSVASAVAKAKNYEKASYILGGAFIAYEGLVVTKFSRTDEYEADRVGMMYMAKAGYDPRAAVRIWERASKGGGSSGSPLDMLSTHPNDADRMRALQQQLPAAMEIYGNR